MIRILMVMWVTAVAGDPAGGPVRVQRSLEKGKRFEWRLRVYTHDSVHALEETVHATTEVQAVNPNGTAELREWNRPPWIPFVDGVEGRVVRDPADYERESWRTRIHPDGHLESLESPERQRNERIGRWRQASWFLHRIPAQLSAGSKWSEEDPDRSPLGDFRRPFDEKRAEWKFMGVESCAGRRCARIESTADYKTPIPGRASARIVELLDLTDGWPLAVTIVSVRTAPANESLYEVVRLEREGFVAPAVSLPPIGAAAAKGALRLTFAPDIVRRYRETYTYRHRTMVDDAVVREGKADARTVENTRVSATYPDDTADVDSFVEERSNSNDGGATWRRIAASPLEAPASRSHVQPTGRLLGFDAGVDADLFRTVRIEGMLGPHLYRLPNRAVVAGDTWTGDGSEGLPLGYIAGWQSSAARHKLVRIEPCGAARCAVIESTYELAPRGGPPPPGFSGGGTGHTRAVIGLDDGWPRQLEGEIQIHESRPEGGHRTGTALTVKASYTLL